jgi:uncharacterized protein YifN (PemK superfamily)
VWLVGGGRRVGWQVLYFFVKKKLIFRQNYIILLVCNGDIALPLSGFTAPAYSVGANFLWRVTLLNPPNYVKSGQVFMCRFEDCWDNTNSRIYVDKSIIANIKPEIGKVRPIVIIHPHKHYRLALVVPFTTQHPQKEKFYTAFVPKGCMPGILAKKECWALCDMLKTVSLDRLQLPFCGEKNLRVSYKDTMLESGKLVEIKSIVESILRN